MHYHRIIYNIRPLFLSAFNFPFRKFQEQPISTQTSEDQPIWNRILRGLIVYSLWLVSAALLFLIVVYYLQSLIFDSWIVYVREYQDFTRWRVVRQFSTFVLGAAWLGAVMFAEGYVRKFLNPRTSLKKLFKLLAIEGIILGVVAGLHALIL